MNKPADDGRDTEGTTCEEGASTRRAVTTWEAFDTLPHLHHRSDPTYRLLRSAGYRPVSVATCRVRRLCGGAEGTRTPDHTEEELLSLCERCSTDAVERSTEDGEPAVDGVIDTRVWVAFFENERGDCFVHVDGSGYDQKTVSRHFGGCCHRN